jgi:AcrR family transcriptional regulator
LPTQSLNPEQLAACRSTVRDLTAAQGLDGWRLSDLAEKSGVASADVLAHFSSKEYALLDGLIESGDALLSGGTDWANGRSVRTRVLKAMGSLTDLVVGSPELAKAMVRALTCGQEAIAPPVRDFGDRLRLGIARAVAGAEPGDPAWATAEVLLQVWLAAVIAWSSGLRGEEYIEASVRQAVRLLSPTN